MTYATTADLAEYLGDIPVGDLPDDVDRLLARASEMIDRFTFGRIDTDDDDHVDAVRDAVCAQVEWWVAVDDEFGTASRFAQFRVGNLSVSGGSDALSLPGLAPRAFSALFAVGLTFRGVSMR